MERDDSDSSFRRLYDWIRKDRCGREILRLLRDGDEATAKRRLNKYLHRKPLPASVSTDVTGGTIERLINIAHADNVQIRDAGEAADVLHAPQINIGGTPAPQLIETLIPAELARRAGTSYTARSHCRRLNTAIDAFIAHLPHLRRPFQRFADHCYTHAVQVVDAMGRILGSEQTESLTSLELFLLVAGALVQDIAVVVAADEASILASDPTFIRERRAVFERAGLRFTRQEATWGVDRLLASDYIRHHQNRHCRLVVNPNCPVRQALVGDSPDFADCLDRILRGQVIQFSDVLNLSEFPTNERVGADVANVLFVTILLRVGAILDLKTPRVSPALRGLAEPLAVLSTDEYWEKCADVKVRGLGPRETIQIVGTSPTQNAQRLLLDWVRHLREECEHAVLTLNSGPERYSLRLGRIEDKIEPAKGPHGNPLYEFHNFHFNLDEEQVFRRLFGQRLYGRVDAAIRELVQNAVDATRVRIALDRSRQQDWSSLSVERQREAFLHALSERAASLELKVIQEVRHSRGTGREETWLHVVDRGVGMSREVIEHFLLKVGRSRWREDPDVRALGIGTVGEFGVGFLSCFMISDRTIIETQSCLPDQAGIRATIYNWRGYLATEPLVGANVGTRVSLLLKADVAAGLPPIADVVASWCPFLELPVRVIGPDRSETLLDVAKPGRKCERLSMFCFAVGDKGSMAAIRETSRLQDEAADPAVSQDGLSVPDVPPPILERPDQQTLRRLGLRVDLRGEDRVPLDLSRNLVEGGADVLWARVVPEIWRGLVKNGLGNKGAQSALADYVQAEFERSLGKAAFFVGPRGDFSVAEVESCPKSDQLGFVDTTDKNICRFARSPDGPMLVLPEAPGALYYGWEAAYVDVFGGEKEDPVAAYWRRKGGHPGRYTSWGFDEDEPTSDAPSLRALTSYTQFLFGAYPRLARGEAGSGKLVSRRIARSVAMSSLGFWNMSANWSAIRSPVDGLWKMVNAGDRDIVLKDLPVEVLSALSFEQYVLLLLYDLWPSPGQWLAGWPGQSKLGDLVIRGMQKAQDARDTKNPYVDDEDPVEDEEVDDDDDKYASVFEDDDHLEDHRSAYIGPSPTAFEDDEDIEDIEDKDGFYDEYDDKAGLDSAQRRRCQRHGIPAKDLESVSESFARDALPFIQCSVLWRNLTPWDREHWEGVRSSEVRRAAPRKSVPGRDADAPAEDL